jgi:hypothetical protein
MNAREVRAINWFALNTILEMVNRENTSRGSNSWESVTMDFQNVSSLSLSVSGRELSYLTAYNIE